MRSDKNRTMPSARAAIARTEYLPEFGRAVRIREFDRPMMSDDVETAQTVGYMDEIAAADARDPAVADAATEALEIAGLDSDSPAVDKARAIFWWLKGTVRYVPTPGTSPLVDQTLITPCTVLAMPEPIGDCPQFSMLANAMFRVLCMNSLFVTIAAADEFPDQWSHIYNTVEVAPGVYMPFDSSNGPEPGAEYSRPYKRRVWPRISASDCERKNDMVRSSRRTAAPGMRNRVLRGTLGDTVCDDSGNCYDTDTGTQLTCMTANGQYALASDPACSGASLPGYVPSTQSPAPGGAAASSNPLTALINAAASVGTALGTSALKTQAKPYYITGPNGQQVLYNPATGTAASTASAISPTLLLVGGLILGGALLLGGKR